VPDKAYFTVFRHTVQGETLGLLRQEVEEAVKRAGIRGTWSMKFRDAPHPDNGGYHPYTISESNPYTKTMKSSIQEVTGKEAAITYFPSIGDFNYLGSRVKIPTYVFGPHGGSFHAPDEYVELDTVVQTAKVISEYLTEILT
jgi:acetylornithine deacetylase/succinyl-diaminopimelate desuccinylase-like protein